jgi:hypothetical protein
MITKSLDWCDGEADRSPIRGRLFSAHFTPRYQSVCEFAVVRGWSEVASSLGSCERVARSWHPGAAPDPHAAHFLSQSAESFGSKTDHQY